ncbi:hypothetical protein [Aeoliella sp. SH292]|uniref:hypothetical protein n=1 Tax=Aeoliella sp. SH292 TaxID=3454464 RepID=UPI003F9DACA8
MEEYIALFVFLCFLVCGLLIAFTPAKTLLRFDRRTGHWIYRNRLQAGYSDEEAIRSAGIFYKVFGGAFILVSTGFLIALVATWLR